jgi:hypothetical protein
MVKAVNRKGHHSLLRIPVNVGEENVIESRALVTTANRESVRRGLTISR